MDDSRNPMRRYHAFRPRQAVLGSRQQVTPVNNPTIELFNDSRGPFTIVVRDFTLIGTSGDTVRVSVINQQVATAFGTVQPMMPIDGARNGVLGSVDTATTFPFIYSLVLGTSGFYGWYDNIPFCMLPPGWGVVWQGATIAHGLTASAIWETIEEEELDYWY